MLEVKETSALMVHAWMPLGWGAHHLAKHSVSLVDASRQKQKWPLCTRCGSSFHHAPRNGPVLYVTILLDASRLKGGLWLLLSALETSPGNVLLCLKWEVLG